MPIFTRASPIPDHKFIPVLNEIRANAYTDFRYIMYETGCGFVFSRWDYVVGRLVEAKYSCNEAQAGHNNFYRCSDQQLEQLAQAFLRNKSIIDFTIHGDLPFTRRMGANGWTALARLLKEDSNITGFYVYNTDIVESGGLDAILTGITTNPKSRLHSFSLSNTKIRDEEAKLIAGAFANYTPAPRQGFFEDELIHDSVIHISLHPDKEPGTICRLMPSIERSNFIGAEGAQAMLDLAKHNPRVRVEGKEFAELVAKQATKDALASQAQQAPRLFKRMC